MKAKKFFELFLITILMIPPLASLAQDTPLKIPWTLENVKSKLKEGMVFTFERKGSDENGKTLSGTETWEYKRVNEKGIFMIKNQKGPGGKEESPTSVSLDWKNSTPFFSGANTKKVLRQERINVPAGSFNTVVIEVSDVFGRKRTYWAIPELPGVYAKIHDQAKGQDIILTLKSIQGL